MILLDANYILRFLLRDDDKSYEIAKDCIKNSIGTIPIEVFAEVVFVLLKVYQVSRLEIDDVLAALIQHENIVIESKDSMLEALKIFGSKNLDFVDSILCAKSKDYEVKTFDKKLQKCIQGKLK